MQAAIKKAKAMIEAMEYIRAFKDKIVVVKLGGSILEDIELQHKLLKDIAFMKIVGMRPVIVHGGGKHISQAMEQSGIEPQWVHGRRYTDKRTLTIVERTLIHEINAGICSSLKDLGCSTMALHSLGSCVIFAKPLELKTQDGRRLDLGLVGEVDKVNSELIVNLCAAGTIPVIAPIGIDKNGQKLNINADSAAGMVAASVKAEKFVLLSDTHGILMDVNDPESRISSLTEDQVKELINRGIISAGMLPKVEACFIALDGGVGKAHTIDGRIEHSLLLEIYTEQGIGTQIIR
jgi:acetylglutamate kinase